MKTLRAELLCVSSSCQTIMGLAMWSLAARRDTIAHCTDHWTGNRADQSHEISQRLMALDLNELIIYKANRQVFQNWDKLDRANVHVKLQMGYNNHYIFMVHYDTAATARFTTTFISIDLVFFQFWHRYTSIFTFRETHLNDIKKLDNLNSKQAFKHSVFIWNWDACLQNLNWRQLKVVEGAFLEYCYYWYQNWRTLINCFIWKYRL